MKREEVVSSNIRATAYSFEERVLEIEFHPDRSGNAAVWQYADVPESVAITFVESDSKGRAFQVIKAGYVGKKVAIVDAAGVETPLVEQSA